MWPELELALRSHRASDALRLAAALWAQHRSTALADLVDALASFIDSDPRSAPKELPDDPVTLAGWIANASVKVLEIWSGSWWTREWRTELMRLHEVLRTRIEAQPDPRLATMIAAFLLEPFIVSHAGTDSLQPFVELLATLADVRVIAPMMEIATSPQIGESARSVAAHGIVAIDAAARAFAPLAASEEAIVAAGLTRYREEPRRYIDLILDPDRERDDGTEQVCSDALSELGHPYGEAIALQYDAAARIISAAGRERLKTLLICHEERWLGRDLFLSLEDRAYRSGVLDEGTLRPGWRHFPANAAVERALDDVRVARLRVLRSGADDWDAEQASMIRASRWLSRSLEWLDAPSLEFLYAACDDTYPSLVGLRLQRLRPMRSNPRWSGWAPALSSWLSRLPALREVVFRTIPEDGLEGIILPMVQEKIHERVRTITLDSRSWSWVLTGERDPTRWFEMLDAHGVTRATLHVRGASLTVEWTAEGALIVTLQTSEGGEVFDLLLRIPKRPLARLILDEHPGKRTRRLEHLGRLKRLLADIAPQTVVMPVRWRNWLAALP